MKNIVSILLVISFVILLNSQLISVLFFYYQIDMILTNTLNYNR
jgi:hypothetical protein